MLLCFLVRFLWILVSGRVFPNSQVRSGTLLLSCSQSVPVQYVTRLTPPRISSLLLLCSSNPVSRDPANGANGER